MGEELAVNGGEPVREDYLPYGRHHLTGEDKEAVLDVLDGDWITQGPRIEEFEEAVCSYVDASHGVAVNSGTSALHLAFRAARIESGDEVITSPLTFVATANAVLYCGGKPVFADIKEDTLNLDPEEVKERITDSTKAMAPVHYAGQPCEMDALLEIAEDNDLLVVEDAAHALGAEYRDERIGSMGDLTAFSFHPVKHITTAEGGMVVTEDSGKAEMCRRMRNHGMDTSVREREETWKYDVVDLGYNYRISDVHAALGISQMERMEEKLERRKEIAERYREEFSSLGAVRVPEVIPDVRHAWHIFPVMLELGELEVGRKEVFKALRAENIGVNVHYIPVPRHSLYAEKGYDIEETPVADDVYRSLLTLPLFPEMDDGDIKDVVQALEKVVSEYGR